MPNKAKPELKQPLTEQNTVKAWLNRSDPMLIATHQCVDADAAFSAALLHVVRPSSAVVFVRADSTISQPEVIAVDLMKGTSAVKGLDAGSSFGLIVSVLSGLDSTLYNELKPWASQLNITDQGKSCGDRVVLADMVNAWRSAGLDDSNIVERASELLKGKMQLSRRRANQKKRAKSIPIKNGVAVLGEDDHVRAKDLFNRGALAVVRQGKGGLAVVLSRKAQQKGANLSVLVDDLNNGWFIHPDGFLVSYGGPKAPKNPLEAGISIKALANRTRKLIKEVKQ